MVGGVNEMSGDCSMTATEMSRLKEWLKLKGVSAEEILDCIDYIAYGKQVKETGKEPNPPLTK